MSAEKQGYNEDKDYTLRSRMIVFEEEIEFLKELMYGEKTLVWTYMADSQGKYSEEKTVKLVDQIVDGERYQRMHVWDYDEQADKLPFYKSLLYCVLRTYTSDYVECGGGNRFGYGKPEEISFFRIMSVFEEPGRELLDGSAVYFMKTLYEIFERKEIRLDALNRRQEVKGIAWEEAGKEEAAANESMEEVLASECGYDISEIRDEEQRTFEEAEQQAVAEKDKVIRHFGEKEHFCRSLEETIIYLKEKNLSAEQLYGEMKELISGFLFDKGIPVFLDENAYTDVMVQLKKTIRTAQKYMEDWV